jgi:hypothetical protein
MLGVVEKRIAPSNDTTQGAPMNKSFVAAATLALSAFAASAAGTDTPRIDQRQANQQQRIDQGVKSGELNKKEAARLEKGHDRIQKMENKATADGKVTKKERVAIEKAQDRQSRQIRREKHDKQKAMK